MNENQPPQPGLPVPIQENVAKRFGEDVLSRREYGIGIYGRQLEALNGRDAMSDAWNEFCDLGAYLEQVRVEREHLLEILEALVDDGVPDEKVKKLAVHTLARMGNSQRLIDKN